MMPNFIIVYVTTPSLYSELPINTLWNETYQDIIWSKNSVFNFTSVRYSLPKCSETILCLKRQFTVCVSAVSCALEFMEARNSFQWVVWTSVWSIHYSGELCYQNCTIKASKTLMVWSMFCYTARSDKSDARHGVPDQLRKGGDSV